MSDKFQIKVIRESSYAVIQTLGYINDKGGEKSAEQYYILRNNGIKRLVINIAESPIVNSLGIAALIRLIENVRFDGGKIAFYNCTTNIAKIFQIMDLTQFTEIHPDEKSRYLCANILSCDLALSRVLKGFRKRYLSY
ncbi:STAS domain-containing protein [Gemmatimonadota bacterium]